jgi:preprotein translocase subunit SecE
MAIPEDIKRTRTGGEGSEPSESSSDEATSSNAEGPTEGAGVVEAEFERAEGEAEGEEEDEELVGVAAPSQLGTRRFVYAAYFGGAIAIAFLASKFLNLGWYKLQTYKPAIGEPRDEVVMPIAGLIGVGAAVYYWRRTRARELAEEVATEMSKVTWPSRTEVTNGTVIVIVTTLISTVFFALMDKFWGFVTNLVYGGT